MTFSENSIGRPEFRAAAGRLTAPNGAVTKIINPTLPTARRGRSSADHWLSVGSTVGGGRYTHLTGAQKELQPTGTESAPDPPPASSGVVHREDRSCRRRRGRRVQRRPPGGLP